MQNVPFRTDGIAQRAPVNFTVRGLRINNTTDVTVEVADDRGNEWRCSPGGWLQRTTEIPTLGFSVRTLAPATFGSVDVTFYPYPVEPGGVSTGPLAIAGTVPTQEQGTVQTQVTNPTTQVGVTNVVSTATFSQSLAKACLRNTVTSFALDRATQGVEVSIGKIIAGGTYIAGFYDIVLAFPGGGMLILSTLALYHPSSPLALLPPHRYALSAPAGSAVQVVTTQKNPFTQALTGAQVDAVVRY